MIRQNKIVNNIFWNIGTQVLNNLFPLVITPYMIYTLGAKLYGSMIVALSFWGLANLFIQFGFQVTASKKLANNKTDYVFVQKYISIIYQAKFLLSLLSIPTLLLFMNFSGLNSNISMMLYTIPFIIGSLLQPNWIYIGIGEFKKQAKLTLFSKVISISLLIVVSILGSDMLLILMYSSTTFITSLVLLFGMRMYKPAYSVKSKFRDVLVEIKDGSEIFIASFSTGAFIQLIPIVLDFYFGPVYVTVLNVCDAIRRVLYQTTQSIFQVIYQNTNALINSLDKSKPNPALKKSVFFVFVIYSLLGVLTIIAQHYLESYFSKIPYFDIDLVYLVLLSGFTNMLMNALGVQVLIPLGYKRYLRNSFISSFIISLPFMLILIKNLSVNGALLSMLCFDVLVIFILIYKHKLEGVRSII
ncbi:lipopolysaccharide biosynthesis protein [Shewanella sp. MSW]|uniref:lipopolysaccharide biosynthesis protein n=1 Tax=Shewanella sp. MSW TaxID=2569536 RepID=UPI001184EA90|nr:oligosaccharide flippase family protein [Shewanella sp. MSW]TVP09756.1 hypothetical protein AYI96_14920 [Shewanella sp. MSW]